MTESYLLLRYYQGNTNIFRADVKDSPYPNYVPVDMSYGADAIVKITKDGEGVTLRNRRKSEFKMYYSSEEITMMVLQARRILEDGTIL